MGRKTTKPNKSIAFVAETKGEQIPEEQLDFLLQRSYEELFVARLRGVVRELGFELIPLDNLEEGEE